MIVNSLNLFVILLFSHKCYPHFKFQHNRSFSLARTARNTALAGAMLLGAPIIAANDARAQGLEVSTVLDNMNAEQTSAYLSGIVEGLAYARYEREGQNAEGGMKCIQDWYYNGGQTARQIILAFDRFKDYPAVAVVAAMAKQKCGD